MPKKVKAIKMEENRVIILFVDLNDIITNVVVVKNDNLPGYKYKVIEELDVPLDKWRQQNNLEWSDFIKIHNSPIVWERCGITLTSSFEHDLNELVYDGKRAKIHKHWGWDSKYSTHKTGELFKKRKLLPVEDIGYVNHKKISSTFKRKNKLSIIKRNEKRINLKEIKEEKFKRISLIFKNNLGTVCKKVIAKVPISFWLSGTNIIHLSNNDLYILWCTRHLPASTFHESSVNDINQQIRWKKHLNKLFLEQVEKGEKEPYRSTKTPKYVIDKAYREKKRVGLIKKRRKSNKQRPIQPNKDRTKGLVCFLNKESGEIIRIPLHIWYSKDAAYKEKWHPTSKNKWRGYQNSLHKFTYKEIDEDSLLIRQLDNRTKKVRLANEKEEKSRRNTIISCTKNRRKRKKHRK